jgi:hypothetical protein
VHITVLMRTTRARSSRPQEAYRTRTNQRVFGFGHVAKTEQTKSCFRRRGLESAALLRPTCATGTTRIRKLVSRGTGDRATHVFGRSLPIVNSTRNDAPRVPAGAHLDRTVMD